MHHTSIQTLGRLPKQLHPRTPLNHLVAILTKVLMIEYARLDIKQMLSIQSSVSAYYYLFKNDSRLGGLYVSGFKTFPSSRFNSLPDAVSTLDMFDRATSSNAPMIFQPRV